MNRLLFAAGALAFASAVTAVPHDMQATVSRTEVVDAEAYVIHLAGGALPAGSATAGTKDRATVLAAQDAVLAQLRRADSGMVLLNRMVLTGNAVRVKMSKTAADVARTLTGVSSVLPASSTTAFASSAMAATATATATCENASPLPGAPQIDPDDVVVAIVNTGVDYTHAALGGVGTVEAYEEAVANARVPWDGFPTDVVVAGADVNGGAPDLFDRNPLDSTMPLNFTQIGEGTMVAGLIHRDAPHAKIIAYKVVNLIDLNGTGQEREFWDITGAALEHVVDPNQDGCTDDRADILVIPSSFYDVAHRAYYHEDDLLKEAVQAGIDQLRAVAAHGVLVVTDTGSYGEGGKYSLTYRSATPEALSVGSAVEPTRPGDAYRTTAFNPHGPVRGKDDYLKPDLVAVGRDDVAIVGTGNEFASKHHHEIAAAHIAAMAANIMQARPGLSATAVKALLVNTADSDVVSALTGDPAEVTEIGHGMANLDAALASPVIVYDAENYLPGINFGFNELAVQRTFEKRLHLRNLSESPQTYSISVFTHDGKPSNEALSWDVPSSVTIGANASKTISVRLTIDPAKLGEWPFDESPHYTVDAWKQVELNGYLRFTPVNDIPVLQVAWLAKARAKATIEKHFDTLTELHNSDFNEGEFLSSRELRQEFTNTSVREHEYAAYPLIAKVTDPAADARAPNDGNILRLMGGGMFDDARCDSGRKLSVAVSFWAPADIAYPHHLDVFGNTPHILSVDALPAMTVFNYGFNVSVDPVHFRSLTREERGVTLFAFLLGDGRVVTKYESMNTGEVFDSKLPASFPAHSGNLVIEACAEELLNRYAIKTVDDLNQNFGWAFFTDRHSLPQAFGPMPLFNPVVFGRMDDQSKGAKVGLRKTDSDAYAQTLKLAPGERGVLHAAYSDDCIGEWLECPIPEFLFMARDANYAISSPVALLDDRTSLAVPMENQVLEVPEHAEAGFEIGRILLDTEGFFGTGDRDDDYGHPFVMRQVNALPGEPVRVAADGTVTVSNPAALDYEDFPSLTLKVLTEWAWATSDTVDVAINLGNRNDNAPQVADAIGEQVVEPGADVFIDAASYFMDPDQDPLTFRAEGLPQGLVIDRETAVITGRIAAAGESDVRVVAADGEHEAEATFVLKAGGVEEKGRNGGGGAAGTGFAAFLLFALMNRLRGRNSDSSRKGSFMKKTVALFALLFISAHATLPAHAGSDTGLPERNARQETAGAEKIVKDGRTLYFVILRDEPLATYRGGVTGLAATNIAVAPDNAGARGKLNANSAKSRSYRSYLQAKQNDFLSSASSAVDRRLNAEQRYDIVLNGFSMYLTDAEAQVMRSRDDVKIVSPVMKHRLMTDRGPAFVGAPVIWNGEDLGVATMGEGVVVGVLDTGIDPTNPVFAAVGSDGYAHVNPRAGHPDGPYVGDCANRDYAHYCNDKLIGIVSFPEITDKHVEFGLLPVGLDYNGHGTHVASTAAGNIVPDVMLQNPDGTATGIRMGQISGVAPHANIIAYHVCDAITGGCLTDLTVRSLQLAVEHGVDVINYSVGGTASASPWDDPHDLAFLGAREAGLHVAIAAGNEGPAAGTVASPAVSSWVTSVAAVSHDRIFTGKQLLNFTGGDDVTRPLAPMDGKGITGAAGGQLVYSGDLNDPRCVNPLPSDVGGRIVVCERGENLLIDKVNNVLEGGGSGMVLVNVEGSGQDLLDVFYPLPVIHLSATDGAALIAWLTASAGAAEVPGARMTAARPGLDATAGDIVTGFSSRGPNPVASGVLTPSLAAPGYGILAAWTTQDTGATEPRYNVINGTSMATPHVAGALALVLARQRALHPGDPDSVWTPAEAQSALMLTATPVTRAEDVDPAGDVFVRDATAFDAGAGSLRVNRAVQAGLVLDEVKENYEAANPALGGDPSTLNVAALVQNDCVGRCSFTRTFRATGAGDWTVAAVDVPDSIDIDVSPASFTMEGIDDVQALDVTVTLNGALPADWQFAGIELVPASSGLVTPPTLHMPLAVKMKPGVMPKKVSTSSVRNSGLITIPGIRVADWNRVTSVRAGLTGVDRYPAVIPADETPDNLFDNPVGPFQCLMLDVKPGTRALVAKIAGAEAADLDLYVGKELDGQCKATGSEFNQHANVLCRSANASADERCELLDPPPGTYSVLVHNFEGSAPGAADAHVLEIAMVRDDADSLSLKPPADIEASEPFDLDVEWQHAMVPGETYYGTVHLGTDDATPDNIGPTLIEIRRLADDIAVDVDKSEVMTGGTLRYTISLADNASEGARTYSIDTTLPDDWTAASASHDGVVDAGDIHWNIEQPANAAGESVTFDVNIAADATPQDVALEVRHRLEGFADVGSVTAPVVSVDTLPVAMINGDMDVQLAGKKGRTITLRGDESRASRPGDVLAYTWRQLSGPKSKLDTSNPQQLVVTLPEKDGEAVFELIVNDGRHDSAPARATVKISGENTGGGANDAFLLLLLIAGLSARFGTRLKR